METVDGLSIGQTPEGFRSGFVSIIGRPNVGKSTLVNRILGTKVAITSKRPQTTRNAIRGVLTTPEAQVVFVDTPGFHKPRTALGTKLNSVVMQTMREVDAILFVVDAAEGVGRGDSFIASELAKVSTPTICVLNKCDLLDMPRLAAQVEHARALGEFHDVYAISALTGSTVPDLVRTVTELLPTGPLWYPPDAVTDQAESVLVAELVREKALRLTREEVPHSIAVVVEEMREDPDTPGRVEIDVIVYVERDSQKGIVIGKGGEMLKRIGAEARREIEPLIGAHVYLDLRVKVKRDWQRQPGLIDRFGYGT
ncbi:MAG TPA: GTPase Era [Actinomycetota bacterium]|nr:GTPase Era [Actinomycetota bacterium]